MRRQYGPYYCAPRSQSSLMFAATGFAVCWSVSISRETFCPYIRNAEAAFRNKSVTEFLHRWFEDGRVADRSKKEKHQGNGRTTIEHPESRLGLPLALTSKPYAL
jgi:hypothetical protein